MFSVRLADRVERGLAAVTASAAEALRDPSALTPQSAALLTTRLLASNDATATEHLGELLAWAGARDRLDLTAAIVGASLHASVSPSAVLRSRRSPVPEAVLARLFATLDQASDRFGVVREATAQCVQTASETFHLQSGMAARIAHFRQVQDAASTTSVTARIRASRADADAYRALVGPTPPPTLAANLATFLPTLLLTRARSRLRVILAHVVPLLRPELYDDTIGVACLLGLRTRMAELAPMRLAWLQTVVQREKRPERLGAGAEVVEDDLYRLELRDMLVALKAAPADQRVDQPDPVYLERAFNDLGDLLMDSIWPLWRSRPAVAVPLLELLSELKSVRMGAPAIVEQTLADARAPEVTVLAVLRFARRWLTGLTATEYWQTAGSLRPGMRNNLAREAMAVAETDAKVRAQIEGVVEESRHSGKVRLEAMYTLLSTRPGDQELRRLCHRAVAGDAFLVEAFLRFVRDTQAHSQADLLQVVQEHIAALPNYLGPLLLAAVAAARHTSAVPMLRDAVLQGDPAAEHAVAAISPAQADQLRLGRQLGENVRLVDDMTGRQGEALRAEGAHVATALRSSSAADMSLVEAAALGTAAQATAGQFLAHDVDTQIQLIEQQREIEALQRQVPELRDRLLMRQGDVERTQRAVEVAKRQLAGIRERVEALENANERDRAGIEKKQDERRTLQRRQSKAQTEIDSLSEKQKSLTQDIQRISRQGTTQEEREAAQRRIHKLRGRVDEYKREIAGEERKMAEMGQRVEAIPGEIRQLEEKIRERTANANELEDEASRVQARLPPLEASLNDLRSLRNQAQRDLNELRDQIHAVLRRIESIKGAADQTASRFRSTLLQEQQAQQTHARDAGRHRSDMTGALEAARGQRAEVERLNVDISLTEQQNLNMLESIDRNKEHAGRELGQADAASALAEKATGDEVRNRQTLAVSVDIFLRMLLVSSGPTDEAAQVLRKGKAIA